jgi:hypothetical protein
VSADKLTVGQQVIVHSALGDEPGEVAYVGRLWVSITCRGKTEKFDKASGKHEDWWIGRHVTFAILRDAPDTTKGE